MSRENIDDPNDNFLYRGYYEDAHPVSTNTLRSLAGKLRYLQSEQEATIVFAPFFTRQPPTASVDFHP